MQIYHLYIIYLHVYVYIYIYSHICIEIYYDIFTYIHNIYIYMSIYILYISYNIHPYKVVAQIQIEVPYIIHDGKGS